MNLRSFDAVAALLVATGLLAFPSLSTPLAAQDSSESEAFEVDDFAIVDCLLPGRTTRIGKSRVKGPRRPAKTSARDCNIRGGEYVSFDRADCRTSLQFWQDASGQGDAQAAFYVGQIYERGCEGVSPDPSKALPWYEQASEAGYRPARMSLAALYDEGKGVEKNPQKAFNLLSSDLPDDLILIDTQELADLQSALTETATLADTLENELHDARQALEAQSSDHATLERSIKTLTGKLAEARASEAANRQKVEQLQTRLAAAPGLPDNIDFGNYHALVIGNADYQHLDPIPRAKEYANQVATVLERQYGFKVERLMNATYEAIYRKLETLRAELTEEDNLLIYYVGRSSSEPGRSYWQPIDAEGADSKFNWLEVERHLSTVIDVIQARQLLVVADAAFEGVRIRSAVPQLPTGMTARQKRQRMKEILERRSRMVMASGQGPSGFSPALLECLEKNHSIAGASSIYGCVMKRLAQQPGGRQAARYAPIRWGRSDSGGDFFFVPEPGAGAPGG